MGAEDGVAVEVEPAADLPESLLEDRNDAAVGGRAHVEQQVAAERDYLHERAHDLVGREHVRECECAPVAPGARPRFTSYTAICSNVSQT